MDLSTVKRGYREVTRALVALETLRDAIHIAREGCGLGIPTDSALYVARIHKWLLAEQAMLEHELGLDVE